MDNAVTSAFLNKFRCSEPLIQNLIRNQLHTFMAFPLHQLTALHIAAKRGYIEIVEYLLSNGADIDIQDDKDKVIICDYSTDQYCIAHLSLNQQRM